MTECIPGSTDEQLPAHILSLLTPYSPTYRSTACEAAGQLAQLIADLNFEGNHGMVSPDLFEQIGQWRRTMHQRCRLTNKFTGIACTCTCHETS
jgi:hypothetical protein